MELRSGIRLLAEVEGTLSDPLTDGDRCDAVLKFYRNRGEPLLFPSRLAEAVPSVTEVDGRLEIKWQPAELVMSNMRVERGLRLSRGDDLLPGIYYTLLGMRAGGYRHVAIPPHLYAHSMHEFHGIDRESVIKVECFVMRRL